MHYTHALSLNYKTRPKLQPLVIPINVPYGITRAEDTNLFWEEKIYIERGKNISNKEKYMELTFQNSS